MARMASANCHWVPSLRKYFPSICIGRPRWISNWVYEPARARASGSRAMSVPRISTSRVPSAMRPSATSMASEYASCPVLAAADHRRSRAPAGRAACSRGSACVRRCVKGLSSRKKKLSLVVIASTTSRARGVCAWLRSRAASASSPGIPSRLTSGASRVSSRYVLSGPIARPEPACSTVAKTSKLSGVMCSAPRRHAVRTTVRRPAAD